MEDCKWQKQEKRRAYITYVLDNARKEGRRITNIIVSTVINIDHGQGLDI